MVFLSFLLKHYVVLITFYNLFATPGDYTPEKSASLLLDNSPKYTFGMKTSVGKLLDTPGKDKI